MEIKVKEIREEKNRTCYICNNSKDNGANIMGKLICRECLKKIGTTNIDEVKYNMYKDKIKNIIKSKYEVQNEKR